MRFGVFSIFIQAAGLIDRDKVWPKVATKHFSFQFTCSAHCNLKFIYFEKATKFCETSTLLFETWTRRGGGDPLNVHVDKKLDISESISYYFIV